jgi:N-acetylneuraminic acid mutarotase
MRSTLLIVAILSGCASATEDDVLTTRDSAVADSAPEDTAATDTGSPDTTIACDAGATCTPGETRTSACGSCGTVTDTCDPDTCTWSPGVCKGEGCEAGSVESVDCTGGEKKTRTCDSMCKWSEFSACAAPSGWRAMAVPPTAFAGRYNAVSAWTGTEMIAWGGRGAVSATSTGVLSDGAAYDPKKDTWRTIAAASTELSKGRELATAVFASGKLMIWGGQDATAIYATGALYDPAADTWKSMAASPLGAHSGAVSVWSTTTNELLIWAEGEGAHYDPGADKWTMMPAAPISSRNGERALFVGGKMIVWSGCPGGGACSNDGASYDPATKTWTKLADPPAALDGRYGFADVFDGSKMIVWGGYGGFEVGNTFKKTGAKYDPTSNAWTMISPTPDTALTPPGREGMAYWQASGKLYVFGGMADGFASAAGGGAIYDPTTDGWSAMPTKDQPLGRADATFVWTGKEAIVWGGTKLRGLADGVFRDGALFTP